MLFNVEVRVHKHGVGFVSVYVVEESKCHSIESLLTNPLGNEDFVRKVYDQFPSEMCYIRSIAVILIQER